MFYAIFLELCAQSKESPSGVARKIGLSNAAANGWKNGKMPSEVTLVKLAQHFGVSVDYLKGKEKAPAQADEREITFDEFSFAMHNHSGDLTDSDKDTLLKLAQQLADANRKKKKNGETH